MTRQQGRFRVESGPLRESLAREFPRRHRALAQALFFVDSREVLFARCIEPATDQHCPKIVQHDRPDGVCVPFSLHRKPAYLRRAASAMLLRYNSSFGSTASISKNATPSCLPVCRLRPAPFLPSTSAEEMASPELRRRVAGDSGVNYHWPREGRGRYPYRGCAWCL